MARPTDNESLGVIWDELVLILAAIAGIVIPPNVGYALDSSLQSNGQNVATWVWSLTTDIEIYTRNANSKQAVFSAVGATPALAMAALNTALEVERAATTYMEVKGITCVANDAAFATFTASAIIRRNL